MRKLFAVLVLVVVAFLVYQYRMQIFVRDPLGSLTRNDVKEAGAQIFVNYANDVLLENDNPPMYVTLLQHGEPVSAPMTLKCIHYLVCLIPAQPAPQSFVLPGAQLQSMTSRQVAFRDGDGRQALVRLH